MGLLDKFLGGGKPKILVVDDDPGIRDLVKDLLTIEGYDVHLAEDGMEGLARLKKTHFDLIISDVHMPRLEGPDLLAVIRGMPEYKTQPVMMFSTTGEIETLNKLFALGALEFIPKPFAAADLLAKVRAHFTKK